MSGVPGELLQQQLQRMRDDMIELLRNKAGSHLHDTVENLVGAVGAARTRLDDVEERGGQRVAGSAGAVERPALPGRQDVTRIDLAPESTADQPRRMPFPEDLVPEGQTRNTWGRQVWGVGVPGAHEALGRSAADWQAQGMTMETAQPLKEFYDNEYARNPKNATAKARSELMKDIITKLGD